MDGQGNVITNTKYAEEPGKSTETGDRFFLHKYYAERKTSKIECQ